MRVSAISRGALRTARPTTESLGQHAHKEALIVLCFPKDLSRLTSVSPLTVLLAEAGRVRLHPFATRGSPSPVPGQTERGLSPSRRSRLRPPGGPVRQRWGHGDTPVRLPCGSAHMGASPGTLRSLARETPSTTARKAQALIKLPNREGAQFSEPRAQALTHGVPASVRLTLSSNVPRAWEKSEVQRLKSKVGRPGGEGKIRNPKAEVRKKSEVRRAKGKGQKSGHPTSSVAATLPDCQHAGTVTTSKKNLPHSHSAISKRTNEKHYS